MFTSLVRQVRSFRRAVKEKQIVSLRHEMILLVVLTIFSMLHSVAADIYLPAYPHLIKEFSISNSLGQATLSFFLLGILLTQMLFGYLSEQYGRQAVLIPSVVLFALTSLYCFYTSSIYELIVIRFLQGVGSSGVLVAARAIFIDVLPRARAEVFLSRSIIFVCISPGIAPILGGFLSDSYGWRSNFLFLFILSAILIVASLILLPETLTVETKPKESLSTSSKIKAIISFFKMPDITFYLCIIIVSDCLWWVFLSSAADILHARGFSAYEIGFCYLPAILPFIIMGGMMTWFNNRVSLMTRIQLGMACVIVAILGLSILNLSGYFSPAAFLIAAFLISCGDGFLVPSSVAHILTHSSDKAGVAAGFVGTIQILSGIAGSFFVGLFDHPLSADAYILSSSLLVVVGYSTCFFLFGKKKAPEIRKNFSSTKELTLPSGS